MYVIAGILWIFFSELSNDFSSNFQPNLASDFRYQQGAILGRLGVSSRVSLIGYERGAKGMRYEKNEEIFRELSTM